ncbi:MAG: hypothetical protein CMP91_12490 [Gammaproteobacteria bacterium]|nr:hypothetical protein [Gammaproteobacteria bacterium]|tara:strand:- start:7545 stop:8714 length:1170 start_codon:yes stop_codon:yes gene_type:complete
MTISLDSRSISKAREKYLEFIISMKGSSSDFFLTPNSEASPYARCFAVYGYYLLNEKIDDQGILAKRIHDDLVKMKLNLNLSVNELRHNKPYMQLLTFSLSALKILEALDEYPLADEIVPLIDLDVSEYLNNSGFARGVPRSGNQAMFIAILLIYTNNLGFDNELKLNEWLSLHIKTINKHGFWGDFKTMTHLQFQNGYHQYEIFEYLNAKEVPWAVASDNTASLADSDGHFAPYPGGGGCYDYDAIFLITTNPESIKKHYQLIIKTAKKILSEQNPDGGFCESHYIRPRSLQNFTKSLNHALNASGKAKVERFRQTLTLLRPKYNRIHTHWSEYSREWSESNLWDSWFRMLTLARIDVALKPENSNEWGFINFPGIGYHHSLDLRKRD